MKCWVLQHPVRKQSNSRFEILRRRLGTVVLNPFGPTLDQNAGLLQRGAAGGAETAVCARFTTARRTRPHVLPASRPIAARKALRMFTVLPFPEVRPEILATQVIGSVGDGRPPQPVHSHGTCRACPVAVPRLRPAPEAARHGPGVPGAQVLRHKRVTLDCGAIPVWRARPRPGGGGRHPNQSSSS